MVLLSEIQKTWIERVKKRTGCRCYDDESLSIALKKSKRMCRKALHCESVASRDRDGSLQMSRTGGIQHS